MSNNKFHAFLECFNTMWLYGEAFREYCRGINGFLWFDSCYDKWLPRSEMLENVLKTWAENNVIFNDDYDFTTWLDRESDEQFYAMQREHAKRYGLYFYKKGTKK